MSEIPKSRISKLAAPGTLSRLPRTAAPSTGSVKRPRDDSETSLASKKAKLPPPATRKPLSTRNTVAASRNLLNKTVASAQPSAEKKAPAVKTKRQPWDLKGKMEDMQMDMRAAMNRITALETEKNTLKSDVEEKEVVVAQNSEELEGQKKKNKELNQDLDDLQLKLRKAKDEFETELKSKQRQLEDLQFDKGNLERKNRQLEDDLSSKQAEASGLKMTVAELTSSSAGIEAKLKSTQMLLDEAREKIEELSKISAQQAESIETYEEKQRAYETERRQLHNTIQELKGNIRVYCRIRPLLGQEQEKFGGQHIQVFDDKNLDIGKPDSTSPKNTNEKYSFDFDHVFDAKATQDDVFEEVSQLVQSAIDGYNVCIFAYGQTGSGKTFTMEGDETGQHVGIIPRTIRKIFHETKDLEEKGWKYRLDASFLEIYNEDIRDLLATEKGLKYDIKKVDTKTNEIYVTNVKTEDVTNGDNINSLLKRAKKNRAVAATNCNERSSRSHSVFMLKITGKNAVTSESCTGTLNLVDLAGSERLKDSGSTGQRLEETKNINSSLSNLSKVIMALANHKDGHIPYRDSKLTHLLMNSLGGNSKTLMFVNLSPREDNFSETLNSLRFAKRVNNCQIGTATKKVNSV